MSRPYKYYRQSDFRGGICMEPENAETNQVLDARNVWAPEGKVVSRPGYVGVNSIAVDRSSASFSSARFVGKDGVVGTGATVVVNSMTASDYWYVGSDTLYSDLVALRINATMTANTATMDFYGWELQYWNGSYWKTIVYNQEDNSGGRPFGQTDRVDLYFLPPSDWATTTVASTERYWIRLRPFGTTNNSNMTSASALALTAARQSIPYTGIALFPEKKQYVSTYVDSTGGGYVVRRNSILDTPIDAFGGATAFPANLPNIPGALAVIPEGGIAYLAWGHKVFQFLAASTGDATAATVNILPEIVGTVGGIKSPYHPDYVPALATFPQANLLTYFKGLLWFAGIDGEPFTVRWSAPAIDGAYNVLPEDSFEILAEDDNSPITALAGLNEHLVVFKQDSIWLMVYSGLNDLELPTFTPVKVVSGVGCVAHGSVQQVRGKLIFLGEDGVYAFDGTPNVQKLSETIDSKIAEIRSGRRQNAQAIHWQNQNCYLLSVSVGTEGASSTTTTAVNEPNNFVFVYDYAHGAWWFWDSIEAQTWLRDEGLADEEIIYFADTKARIYKLHGNHDNGTAISSYFTTHRFGQNDAITTTAREVRVRSTNVAGECDITLISTDEDGTAATMELQHSAEDSYGTAVYGTDTYNAERRVERKLARRTQGRWHQVKVAHDQKHKRFECTGVDLGYIVEGRR